MASATALVHQMGSDVNYSSEELAFFAAIADEPLNDAPRLVYADWLDERGDPLGEFIRVLCELHDWDMHPGKARYYELERRERLLSKPLEKAWEERLKEFPIEFVEFDRGLVDRVIIAPDDFVEFADELFALCPWLGQIHLKGSLDPFPASPYWSRIKVLYIPNAEKIGPNWLAHLIEAGGFERLDSQRPADPASRCEQVGRHRQGVTLDVLKDDCRTLRVADAAGDLGEFQLRIDRCRDARELAGSVEVLHEFGQRTVHAA